MRRILGITVLLAGALLANNASAAKLMVMMPLDVTATEGRLPKAGKTSLESFLSDGALKALHPQGWTVFASDATVQVLRDNGMKPEECGEQDCLLEMARALKADAFISSAARSVDGGFSVYVSLAETKSGNVIAAQRVFGKTVKSLSEEFEAKAENFFAEAASIDNSSASTLKPKKSEDSIPKQETSEEDKASTSRPTAEPKILPPPPDVEGPPEDAIRLPSGLALKYLARGTGEKHPSETDRVKVHYTGWTTDGKMFDSSVTRGQPIEFPLDRVIPGWSEAVQQMREGDIIRAWIPEELAYKGRPGTPAGMLVFDIELLDIKEGPKPVPPPPAPPDVARPPKNAQRTRSGLVTKVLQTGTGSVHPRATSKVKVHYTGWTTDGKMFDSSVVRGEPAVFPLNAVIPGWTEGVQLMVEGEKRRIWIPQDLAYQGRPGPPAGMLVFDVELLEIVK